MREIDFRAWDKQTRDMLELYPSSMEFYNKRLQTYRPFYSKHIIRLQYTGLKDRNGREIYEGDIVSMFGGTQFSVVEWDEKFGFYRIYMQLSGASDVGEELLGNHLNVVEVIGNIYENPELLKRVNENESSTAF